MNAPTTPPTSPAHAKPATVAKKPGLFCASNVYRDAPEDFNMVLLKYTNESALVRSFSASVQTQEVRRTDVAARRV